MKYVKSLIICMSLMSTAGYAQSGNEWTSLFDGKSLNGWHLFKKDGVQPAWKVQDGAIYLDVAQKEGRGDLVTNQSFDDFHLKFEWKVKQGSNSGVIFFVQEQEPFKATWHTGPEFQLIDNTGYPDKLNPKQMAGSLYDLIACPTDLIKPTGSWNSAEIISAKGTIRFILNGSTALSVVQGSESWNQIIAASKFKDMKDFARITKGKIALQDHGGEVWFRNILIKAL